MITLVQFVIHFFLIGALIIMWQPLITAAGYDNALYNSASLQEVAIRDALWYFGLIMGVVAMFANILWYYNELKLKQANEQ